MVGESVESVPYVGEEKSVVERTCQTAKFLRSWKTERMREDESGDSEDGEDDELTADCFLYLQKQ